MARSQNSFIKKLKAEKKVKKRKMKEERRKERQENNNKGAELDDMIAYVDEFGNITSTPPEEQNDESDTKNK